MTDPKLILTKFMQADKIPHALLFTGRNEADKMNTALDFVHTLIPDNAIPFDFAHITDSPLAIEKVRELKRNFATGPLAGPHKIALIARAGDLRPDAANTFLKILEDPPQHSLFILMAPMRSSILPTIASRAVEIRFPVTNQIFPSAIKYRDILHTFESGSFGEKFSEAQKYDAKRKSELLNVLDAWLVELHGTFFRGKTVHVHLLKKILQLKKVILSTNASPQLLLEEFFVSSIRNSS